MLTSDDTRPKSPFADQPVDDTQPVQTVPFTVDGPLLDPLMEDGDQLRGPGCLVMFLIGVIALALAAMVIVLSATAGWTQGSQMAQMNATEERRVEIAEQCSGIATEIASNNEVLLGVRLDWMAQLTPVPDCLPVYVPTATALYLLNHPTTTPTPSPEPTAEATLEPIVEVSPPPEATLESDASGQYDLAGLLQEAEQQVAVADWDGAIETLDVIIRIDPNFQRDRVRQLMSQSLNSYAHFLYNSGQYAEAILITNRAEQFGPLADGLAYEREAAQLYLNATRSVGLTYDETIRRLRLVYDLGPGRYYEQVTRLLHDQHVAYGDALLAQGDACFAATQYGFALNYINSGTAASKRDSANFACQNTPPTADPNVIPTTAGGGVPLPDGSPIAPVGSR